MAQHGRFTLREQLAELDTNGFSRYGRPASALVNVAIGSLGYGEERTIKTISPTGRWSVLHLTMKDNGQLSWTHDYHDAL